MIRLKYFNDVVACIRAYFALQGAGFNNTVTDVDALNLLTAGAAHIRLSHFLLAHYISSFKLVKDNK